MEHLLIWKIVLVVVLAIVAIVNYKAWISKSDQQHK